MLTGWPKPLSGIAAYGRVPHNVIRAGLSQAHGIPVRCHAATRGPAAFGLVLRRYLSRTAHSQKTRPFDGRQASSGGEILRMSRHARVSVTPATTRRCGASRPSRGPACAPSRPARPSCGPCRRASRARSRPDRIGARKPNSIRLCSNDRVDHARQGPSGSPWPTNHHAGCRASRI